MNNIQVGEKNAYEYAWSKNIHELIVQLYFQITDTYTYNKIFVIKTIFSKIIKICYENLSLDLYYYYNLLNCYKLILNTRNITYGKGLTHLSYVLLGVWCNQNNYFFIETSKLLINEFVNINNDEKNIVGSWRDIKYLLNYFHFNLNYNMNDEIMKYMVDLSTNQLIKDKNNIKNTNNKLSLVAKWLPRESSKKFGWQTIYFALSYYNKIKKSKIHNLHKEYIIYNKKKYNNVLKKFRKVCSDLNKFLNVCEIKLTSGNSNEINFNKHITTTSLFRHFNSLLHIKNNYENITLTDDNNNYGNILNNPDYFIKKIQCKNNLINFINNFNLNSKFKHKLGLNQYIQTGIQLFDYKQHIKILYQNNQISFNYFNEIIQNILLKEKILNVQWNNYIKNINILEGLIPIIDISFSMGYTYFNNNNTTPTQRNYFFKKKSILNALGMGIIICEKSIFNKRILLFNKKYLWINFETCNKLTDYIERLINYFDNYYEDENQNENGLIEYSSIGEPINLLLDSFTFNNLTIEQVSNIKIIIFSDMQFNDINLNNTNNITIYDKIQEMFNICGINNNVIDYPYNISNFIFWNMRTTNGFPLLTSTYKTLMLSGNNPTLLNIFTKNYKNVIKNPIDNILKMFTNKCYNYYNETFSNLYYDSYYINYTL